MPQSPLRWYLFLSSLPGRVASTPRVRLWRTVKELGATTLRDGVAVLPACQRHRQKLAALGEQVADAGGNAWLLELAAQPAATEERLRVSFDRTPAYEALQSKLGELDGELPHLDEAGARRRLRQATRDFEAIARTDFFRGESAGQARQALDELGARVDRRFSPEEPSAVAGAVQRLDARDYRGRLWATRRHLWVDRVASAWLIRRFIDRKARFLWLAHPRDCPAEAVGFDFDGAAFSHVGERVTFEVLLASFGLETDPGLAYLARLVHYLDVGGVPVPEAAGVEALLAGLRDGAGDDDRLLRAATPVLNALHRRFSTDPGGDTK